MSIPSLNCTVPVHSAVNEYTLSELHCASSLSCEWVYPLWSPLSQFTQLWMSIPSLNSTVPVHSAVNEYTFSELHCPSSLSCEWVYLLWTPLSKFTLWVSVLLGLHYPSSLSCVCVPSLVTIAPVYRGGNELVPFVLVFHCPSSLDCQWVPSLVSIVPVHSLVNEYFIWPSLPQFTQLWMGTLSGLQCPCLITIVPVHMAVNELVPFVCVFHCPSSFSCEWVPSLTSIVQVHSAVNVPSLTALI